MHRHLALALGLLALGLGPVSEHAFAEAMVLAPAPAGRAAALPAGPLAERLGAALAVRALRRSRVAALVVRASDGSVLYERDADRALTPASNMKVLTAIAALDVFGPSHRFETVIATDAAPDGAGRVGVLYVVGGGDPVINSEDWWRLAAGLRGLGLRHVEGDIVVDDAAFDRDRWHPDWGRVSSRAYHAPVGALTANYGAFAVIARPGKAPGDPVAVEIAPPVSYLRLSNRARTASPGARRTLVVDRTAGAASSEVVTVDGVLPAGGEPRTYYRSVTDPGRYAAAVLRMQLEAVGIAVDGEVRRGRKPGLAPELLRFQGRSMGEIVRLFMKYSNNAVAESLVKAMGAREAQVGSWKSGLPVMRTRLGELGLDLAGLSFVDGSGLSYRNKLSPRALVGALRIARRSFRFGPELAAALPIAARDGTLEERADAADGRVRAKTGLLNRVTALSGFAELGDGELAVFSVMTNGYRGSDEEAMAALDGFVASLAAPAVAALGP